VQGHAHDMLSQNEVSSAGKAGVENSSGAMSATMRDSARYMVQRWW